MASGDEATAGGAPALAPQALGDCDRPYPQAGSNLRVMLARLLLEMQGATLSLWDNDEAGIWSACIAFPPQA